MVMPNDHSVFDEALQFAARAHCGMVRKGTHTPFVTHPMEAVVVAAELTDDPQMLAAAVLHDTVEDTCVTLDEIEEKFGARVAHLVDKLTEEDIPGVPPEKSWDARKERAIERISAANSDVKLLALADKLSNMRSMVREYAKCGEELWSRFHQKDKTRHEWYYRSMLGATSELSETRAWKELDSLINILFRKNT